MTDRRELIEIEGSSNPDSLLFGALSIKFSSYFGFFSFCLYVTKSLSSIYYYFASSLV